MKGSRLLLLFFLAAACALAQTLSDAVEVSAVEFVHPTGAVGDWAASGAASLFSTSATTGAAVFSALGGSSAFSFSAAPGFRSPAAFLRVDVELSGLSLPEATSAESWRVRERSVSIASVRGPGYKLLFELLVHRQYGTGNLRGALLFGNWDYSLLGDTFALPTDGAFHTVAVGFDTRAAQLRVWIDNALVHTYFANNTAESVGNRGYCGIVTNNGMASGDYGSFGMRSCTLLLPGYDDIYVDANTGNDANDGTTPATALRTIQAAAYIAPPGSTVHIADGVYREQVSPASGLPGKDVVFKAEGKNARVLGSVAGNALSWSKAASGLWVADTTPLRNYWTDTPRFMVLTNRTTGQILARLHIAREPNYQLSEVWRFTEHWNVADGGDSVPTCTPGENGDAQDCDSSTRSARQLIDQPFKTLPPLVGSRIFVSDCNSGHYIYKRTIASHDKTAGKITVDADCLFDGISPTLGLYSSYYVENSLDFLDVDGEYVLDGRYLYLKLSGAFDFADLEISISNSSMNRAYGFALSQRSNIRIEGLTFMFFEGAAITESSGWNTGERNSDNVTISNCTVLYSNNGVALTHGCNSLARFWTVDHCEFGHIDAQGISTYTPGNPADTCVTVSDFVLKNSYLHDMGFNCYSENRIGSSFINAKNFYILNNQISRVSHNGFQFSNSASSGGQIYSGSILVRGNVFSQSCCGNADCGCLKFWSVDSSHVWKDVLVTENICQASLGWTRPSFNRKLWQSPGYGGFGWYTDHAGGFTFFRNIAFGVTAYGITMYRMWEDSRNILYNNLVVGSAVGLSLGGKQYDQTGSFAIKNNVFIDQRLWSVYEAATGSAVVQPGQTDINNNLYHTVGWDPATWKPGIMVVQQPGSWQPLPTFADISAFAPAWETTALGFSPAYRTYNSTVNASDTFIYSPRFVPKSVFDVTSALQDKGTASLPADLLALLSKFGIPDIKRGTNYDLGPTERDPATGKPVDSDLPPSGEIVPWRDDEDPEGLPSGGDDDDGGDGDSSDDQIDFGSSNHFKVAAALLLGISAAMAM